MIDVTSEEFVIIQKKYEEYYNKYGKNFLVNFYDELIQYQNVGILVMLLLQTTNITKANPEQSVILGMLMMYLLMSTQMENRFQNLIKPSLN